MITAQMYVHAVGDPPLEIEGLVDATQLALQDFIILEKATMQKKTGVVLHFKDATNKNFQAFLTADMFETLAAGLHGVRERFNDIMK